MNHLILLFTLLLSVSLLAQEPRFTRDFVSDFQYSQTDFKIVDSIELWDFAVSDSALQFAIDSIHPCGTIQFRRTSSIDDGISMKVYGRRWTPSITFVIYHLEDSFHCKAQSNRVRWISSCLPPEVGGDYLVVGNLILITRSVCMNCQRYDTKVDYCRPVVNQILEGLNEEKVDSLESLELEVRRALNELQN